MEELFKSKYRIPSARLSGWDYSLSAYYFITICTLNRVCNLGDVLRDDGGVASVALSDIGKIVRYGLLNIPAIYANVRLDTWVIMPNHLHVILEIMSSTRDMSFRGFVETPHWGVSEQRNEREIPNKQKLTGDASNVVVPKTSLNAINETPPWGVSTGERNPHHKPQWKPGVLGSIINQFKGAVTKQCNKFGYDFHWQGRFYDHIIRNEITLNKIRRYIRNNPRTWYRDRNRPEGILM